jgi:aspartate-semialdehyde dehydrogenase
MSDSGLALFLHNDLLLKGAAADAAQVAELVAAELSSKK